MDNPATDIPTLTLRTTTWATPRQNEQCLHRLPTCCTTAGPDGDESKCCACLDDRPHGLLYDEGPNGIIVEDGLFSRWERYCAYCRSKYSFIYMCSYQGLAPRGTHCYRILAKSDTFPEPSSSRSIWKVKSSVT